MRKSIRTTSQTPEAGHDELIGGAPIVAAALTTRRMSKLSVHFHLAFAVFAEIRPAACRARFRKFV